MEHSVCIRCSEKINCMVKEIQLCDCSKIMLSNEQRQFIGFLYNGCICNNCLVDLKKEFQLINNNTHATN